ncbi:MAG: hypothetical protein AAB331_05805, partial [Planctomycetota bacterium]
MFIRHKRCKVFSIQAVILIMLFLSMPLLIIHPVSGNDSTASGLSSDSGDGHALIHQAENPRYHSMLVPLRQRMAEERRNHLSQHEDISFFLHGKDRKGERYGLEDTRYPLSKGKTIDKGIHSTDAELLTWSTEAVDAPRYFDYLSSRAIAVDANNQPHIVYVGDHLYHAYYDGSAWHYEIVDSSGLVG